VVADVPGQGGLSELTSRLLESFQELDSIQHLDQGLLPSSQTLVEIINDLKAVVFPGYKHPRDLDGVDLHWANLAQDLGNLVGRLERRLTDQIARALRLDAASHTASDGDSLTTSIDGRAREIAISFLEALPRIRRLIATDVQAAYDGDPAAGNLDEIICCYPGIEATTVFRLAHELRTLHVPLIPRMMTEWAHGRTGIDIHPGARIGPGFFIDHGTGVVIGETCEIADHVKLYQGVTLGALSFQTDSDGNLVRGTKRHPTIQRKAVIYANATVLGGNTVVGANSVIGAGASITKSVPPNTVVTLEKPSLRFRQAS